MNEAAETQGNSDVWEAEGFESSQAEQLVGCRAKRRKRKKESPRKTRE